MRGLIVNKEDIDSGKYRLSSRMAVPVVGEIVESVGVATNAIYIVRDEDIESGMFKLASGGTKVIVATHEAGKLGDRAVVPVYPTGGALKEDSWIPSAKILGSDKVAYEWFNCTSLGEPGKQIFKLGDFEARSAISAPFVVEGGLYFHANAALAAPWRFRDMLCAVRYADGGFTVDRTYKYMSFPGEVVKRVAFYELLTDGEIHTLSSIL